MTESTVDTRLPASGTLSPTLLRRGALLVSGALLGFALVLWIAANWDGLGKVGRFAVAVAALGAGGIAAIASASLVTPGLLVAFLSVGGLLALIGQTYQTGADTWQLFAAWVALGLPFALAARHDAVWSPLVAVAFTALTLWQSTTELAHVFLLSRLGSSALTSSPVLLLLASWLPAVGLCAILSPGSIAAPFVGPSTRWAFRLAVVLTLANVTGWGIAGLFTSGGPLWSAVLPAIVVVGGAASWLSLRGERDPLLLAGAALAIDALLVSCLVRAVFATNGPSHHAWGQFFVVGIGAALIVAASVVVMLRVIRSSSPPNAGAVAKLRSPTSSAIDHARPWAAVVLSALGALLAALPLLVAFGMLLGDKLMRSGPSAYVIGAVIASGGFVVLRASRSLFLEQLAAIALATGSGLVIYALFRDFPAGVACFLLSAAAFSLAVTIQKPWLGAILGVIGTTALVFAVTQTLGVRAYPGTSGYFVTWTAMAAAWVAATFALDSNRNWLELLPSSPSLDAIAAGTAVAVLGALSIASGTTFLFDGMLGTGMTRVHAGGAPAATWPLAMWLTPQRGLGLATMAAAGAVLVRSHPTLRTPVGVSCIATALLLAFVMPRLGAVALILAVAVTTGRGNLAILAAAAALWIVGNFYYALAWSLTEKAAILAVAGAALGAIAFAIRAPAVTRAEGATFTAVPLATRALAVTGLLLAGGVSAQAIQSKEALIRDGRPVFVELAPADPRSLMQGDYMALRFRLPDGGGRHEAMTGPRPVAIGAIDASGVAKLTRIGTLRDPIGRDEIRIELTPARRSWTIVTNAWFFKEGDAKRWETARYGEFRVLPDGRALLVALADKDRVVIKP